jgi:hypothetical protein
MRKPAEQNSADEQRLKRLISARGLADRYGTHLRTISRWVARGIIPPPDQVIRDRRYWFVQTIERHDREQTIAAANRQVPPPSAP